MKHTGFRIRDPLLNQHDPVVSDVLRKEQVQPILALVVDREVMILQIAPAASPSLFPAIVNSTSPSLRRISVGPSQ